MAKTSLPKYLAFTKMHGLGNDFMVIDGVTQEAVLTTHQVQQWADRNFGVGFDQLLLVEPPKSIDVDFSYRIFNADGSEVEHCGNGARCFARFVRDRQLTHKDVIRVSVAKGQLELRLHSDGQVTVDMGIPSVEPADIPFITEKKQDIYQLELDGSDQVLAMGLVSMGNPHAVIQVKDIDAAPVRSIGPLVQAHDAFPEQCNVGFMQVVSRQEIRLRVFERGVGETLACGTGACAAVVSGRLQGLLDANVRVELLGGALQIHWPGEGPVEMTGPATTVFEGQIRAAN